MIKRHLDNILTYLKHRITNAVAEGINSKIQQMNQQQGDLETLRIIGLLSCYLVESWICIHRESQ
ncbi:MAG: transposase [bacterium]